VAKSQDVLASFEGCLHPKVRDHTRAGGLGPSSQRLGHPQSFGSNAPIKRRDLSERPDEEEKSFLRMSRPDRPQWNIAMTAWDWALLIALL
jgi:hypothetical protein